MVHISEGMNYLRVAGYNQRLPFVYYEFGCHSGRTYSAAINAGLHFGMKDAQYYAFDSFQGLPKTIEEEDGIFKEGTFSTTQENFKNIVKKNTRVEVEDETLIAGFYSETLTPELQAKLPKAGLVYIDVDLYSSTRDVLKFLTTQLVIGSIIMFDDWYCFPPGSNMGEQRAFKEFCDSNPNIEVEEWKNFSTFGKSYFITNI